MPAVLGTCSATGSAATSVSASISPASTPTTISVIPASATGAPLSGPVGPYGKSQRILNNQYLHQTGLVVSS